jgi:hypothetical protein
MSIRTEMTLAALLAVALLAAAFCASAQAGKYEQATFKAEVKGVQTYHGDYHHKSTGPCDPSIDEVTEERAKFVSLKPVKLTITKLPQLKEPVITSGVKQLRLPTKAKVKRSHSNSVGSIAPGCPDNGGGVPGGPGPDCGTRVIQPFYMSVDYYKPEHVELQPEDNAGSDPYERCGGGKFPTIISGETFGRRSSAELPLDEVFDEKIGKLITIGAGNSDLPWSEGTEETSIRWELSLTRVHPRP